MKDQYFGDVNDYRKYGLLRVLQRETFLKLGVCWMLTPGDEGTDGRFTAYFDDTERWRPYDPDLFDALKDAFALGRRVDQVAWRGLLGPAAFNDTIVPSTRRERSLYIEGVRDQLADRELVFLDPDNAIEVPSCPAGLARSDKYVLWSEIQTLYSTGKSLVIYQHFPRQDRPAFVRRLTNELRTRNEGSTVSCLKTPNVAFWVVAQPKHASGLRAAADVVVLQWAGQIHLW